tara:strand:+ start:891 stop:5222 length:4332 start_codon:yes stop_codon:yes gene_type:complete
MGNSFGSLRKIAMLPVWLLAAFLAVMVISVPLDLKNQWIFGLGVMVAAFFVSRNKSRRGTLVLGGIALLVSTRYIWWRTTHTLEFDTPIEFVLGTGLYLAELYAWFIMLLGLIQTSWPLHRPVVEMKGDPSEWPTVDVYIPTYNESLDIVRNTVFAAMDMDYPADRYRVFILDDGRREEFREFAREANCGYLTRTDNKHAKAGNLNAAMKKTDGDLIVVFDCDHVPTRAFLQLTIGWFQRDPKLALLQTPHHFYSPDPVQRNLGSVEDLPGEGDLFYGPVQSGNDLWNATFFCGSCAIIRREALMQTNGFAGETVTEDAHTALKLQRMGWNTAYISARLSAGLATERLILHIGQRIRWARGMTQIFRIDNPLLGKGLKLPQRLCYLNAMMHFQFPLPRIVFLTAPLAYLIAGQNIIHASAALIFAYALPHLYISTLSSERTQGGDRRPFWGEIYETLLAFHLVKPTVLTLFQPRKGKFNVTDKGDLLDKTYFDLDAVKPHMWTIGLMIFGIVFGTGRLLVFAEPGNMPIGTLVLNVGWATFSLIILLAAVSVARETRQVREHIRIDQTLQATLYRDDGYVFDCSTLDFSMGGVAVRLPEGMDMTGHTINSISIPMGDDTLTVPVEAIRTDSGILRLRFEELDQLHARQLVRAVMGRADAWQPGEPRKPVSGMRSIKDIVGVDIVTLKRILGPSLGRVPVTLTAIAALCVLAGTLAPSYAQEAPPVAQAPVTQELGDGQRADRMTLENLSIRSPIRLQGTRAEIGIPFGMRADEVVTEASVTVNMAYSPALLGDLSQLVVMLNGEVIQTVKLLPGGADGTTLELEIEPALFLPGQNQLNFRFLGHYATDCEDPFHSSLWMNISNERTFLDVKVQQLKFPPNLSKLPAPFFDEHDSMPLDLPFVMAARPSDGELEAAGTIASWLGSLASYRGFRFTPQSGVLPEGNAVVFLGPQDSLPGIDRQITGPEIAVVPNPADEFGQLLLIMGRTDAELKQAAAGLAFASGFVGGRDISMKEFRVPAFDRYAAPRWLPTDRKVALSEVTEPYSLEARGLPPGPLSAQFRVAPDLFFWPGNGGKVDLGYRYPAAPWLDRAASRLDVSLNNNFLETLPLGGESVLNRLAKGAQTVSEERKAKVTLPRYNLFGQNELVFDYNLILADKSECTGMIPTNVAVSVLGDSQIDFTGAHHAILMPDLAPFAGAGYPFTIRPDLAETAILMPRDVDAATIETFLVLMGRFGDSTGAPTVRARVTREVNADRMRDEDILVIGPVSLGNEAGLFRGAPVSFAGGQIHVPADSLLDRLGNMVSTRKHNKADEANDTLMAADEFTGMIGFESPFAPSRSVVAVLGSDTSRLPGMIYALEEIDVIADVQGDLSVVHGDGMASYMIGSSYWVSDLPWWLAFAFWMSGRPLFMVISGVIVALIVAGPIYALLKRQERRRLQDMDSE